MTTPTARRVSGASLFCIVVALLAGSCGGNGSPTPSSSPAPQSPSTGGSSSSSATTVTGTEKVGWDQPADSASQLSGFQYIGYVDDVPDVLKNVVCATTSAAGAFACTASLPIMTAGAHRLELATQETGGAQRTSARSPVLLLNVAPKSALLATTQLARTFTSFDGIQLTAETLATGLSAPSSLAGAADGRLFIANRDGMVVVWQNGRILPAPALRLADVAQTSDVGLIGLALDPEFASNGQAFAAYTARNDDGSFVHRVLRLREANGVFGQAVPILEDRTLSAPSRPPRVRVAADHTVYVSLPAADQATADSYASYAGKILRINADGTTPRDNQGATPVISAGEATVGGFDWHPATGRLWVAGRDWQSRDFVRDFLLGPPTASTFEAVVDP